LNQPDQQQTAIVLPLYKERLLLEEQISLNHLLNFLGDYEKFLLVPKNTSVNLSGFRTIKLDEKHFRSRGSYSKLLLSKDFYRYFVDYKYLLIYQLDCLVFSDQLIDFCQLDFDYIGAPLFRDKMDPSKGFSRAGNGGLSLRRVNAFLNVLNSLHIPSWREFFSYPMPDLHKFPWPYRWLKKLRVFRDVRRGVKWYTQHYSLNEDLFWSDRAKLFYPDFKIAPVDVALRFAFEAHPRYCFEKNNHQLPFGCHAWAKWDREFWEPFLTEYELV